MMEQSGHPKKDRTDVPVLEGGRKSLPDRNPQTAAQQNAKFR